MCVCNCLNHFSSFIAPELIIIENSGWGNIIYLFVTEIFHLQVDLLRNSFCTYIEHQLIITNMFGMLNVILFLVRQLISYKIEIVHYTG